MAKRYIKISPFYNRPSTAGPLSAERLNAINDGLEAVDTYKIDVDAIVNNGVTTVEGTVLDGRMGKTLQDQVTTINKNINNKTSKVYNGTITGDYQNTLVENWNAIGAGMSMCTLSQGNYNYAIVSKLNDTLGAAMVFGYNLGNIPQYGVLNAGVWSWKAISLV